ncbi:hypothetical protein B0H16DRAFT_1740125 [Mycena metata]|uniref:F-box domain-containing protein n=1 Tax=Mycena metata TaxID=1033252 RepID=A0AAD7HDW6_9AGAR|nr:hypothetical protein B0H16DRAFT_1740125 [Mycena metata]
MANEPIFNPYPELLSSAAGPPSDAQAVVLMSQIEWAENETSAASAHVAHLQDTPNKLAQHRADSEALVRIHKGVLSALRRLPEEILLEIFQHTLTVKSLHDPLLSNEKAARSLFVANNLPAQVERVRGVPVSICFTGNPPGEILTLCLQLSLQWDRIWLDISSFLSPQLSDHIFSALTTLTLSHPGPEPTADVSRTNSLPALVELSLDLYGSPRRLKSLIPWSQLQKCDLHDLDSLYFLWIIAQLPQDADITVGSIVAGYEDHSRAAPSPTTSLIRSLTLAHYPSFLIDVLDCLSAPALGTFVLRNLRPGVSDYPFGAGVMRFLDRSACTLTHLEFSAHLQEDDLIHVLQSSYVRNLVD